MAALLQVALFAFGAGVLAAMSIAAHNTAYVPVDLGFPSFFPALGPANATFLTAIHPLVGLLAAIFVLPEVYGYTEVL